MQGNLVSQKQAIFKNVDVALIAKLNSLQWGSNSRPLVYKTSALTAEL